MSRFFKTQKKLSQHRKILKNIQSPVEPLDISFKDIQITVNKFTFSIRIYTPSVIANKILRPTIFYIPGTSFIAKEISFTHVFCTHLVKMSQCQLIVLDHRLAPECKFPTASQDIYSLLNYFVKIKHKEFNIDINNIIISGYSSGGNLAALAALQAKKEKIKLKRQILISPMLDLSRSLKGYEKFEAQETMKDHHIFISWFLSLYVPHETQLNDPKISPYWSHELAGLPPTDFLYGENDAIRSDAENSKKKFALNSVDIRGSVMFPSGCHGLLWKNPYLVAEIMSKRIKAACELYSIPKSMPCGYTLIIVNQNGKYNICPLEKIEQYESSEKIYKITF